MFFKNFWANAAFAGGAGLLAGWAIGSMTAKGRRVGSWGGGMGGGATPHAPYNFGNPVWSDYGKKGMYIQNMAHGRQAGSWGGGMGGGATPHGPYNFGNPVWSDYGKKGLYIQDMAHGRR